MAQAALAAAEMVRRPEQRRAGPLISVVAVVAVELRDLAARVS
jgi:hypothetical protein